MNTFAQGICHVHYLTQDDKTERDIAYCKKCDAWICMECAPNLLLRAEAMVIQAKRKLTGELPKNCYSLFPVYFEGKLYNGPK